MLIFLNFFKAPFLVDLKKPELKIPHTVNLYIRVEPGVILGIWHTVPSCRGEDAKEKDRGWYEAALHDGNPIIVYLHGSAEHRAAPHRLELVKVLSDGGFHVLSVDYRGYGDSTGEPTEEGLTTDAVCVYEWTKARSGTTPVCLWGHSLGTGVATNAAKALEEKGTVKCLRVACLGSRWGSKESLQTVVHTLNTEIPKAPRPQTASDRDSQLTLLSWRLHLPTYGLQVLIIPC